MMALTLTRDKPMPILFDTLSYSKRAQQAGYTVQQAEFQAQEFAKLLDDTLVTKADLKHEMTALKHEIIALESRMQSFQYKMTWTLLGGVTTVIGIVQAISHFT
jgi:hypothetical protein